MQLCGQCEHFATDFECFLLISQTTHCKSRIVEMISETLKPGLHDNFFRHGTRLNLAPVRHPPFLSCKWKNSWHKCPQTYGGRDYLSTWSGHSSVLGHSCHESFPLHDKNEGHWGQIQTGTVPKMLSCKPGLSCLFKCCCCIHS